jgi:uncharacterized membrane protein YgaE (UPF0421/DUF939 family)
MTKFFVILALVVSGLCYCPKKSKADMFGVTDAALLVQQVLQYVQDLDISDLTNLNLGQLTKDIENKVNGLTRIINIFESSSQGVKTFRNIAELTKKVARTTRDINNYIQYLSNFGDDFEITRCYYIYRAFDSRTQYILNDLKSVLNVLKKLDSNEGTGLLETIDNCIANANSLLDCVSDGTMSELKEIVHSKKMEEQAEKSNQMSNLVIC